MRPVRLRSFARESAPGPRLLPRGATSGAARVSPDQTLLAVMAVATEVAPGATSEPNTEPEDTVGTPEQPPSATLSLFLLSPSSGSNNSINVTDHTASTTAPWCQPTAIHIPGVVHFSWRAVPELPDGVSRDGIPVPSLKPPSERCSSPVLVAIDDNLECTCVLWLRLPAHSPAPFTSYDGDAMIASFSPPDNQGFATARIQLQKLLFSYGIADSLAHATLHPRSNDQREFSLVLYTQRMARSQSSIPRIIVTLSIDGDAVYLSAVQFFSAADRPPPTGRPGPTSLHQRRFTTILEEIQSAGPPDDRGQDGNKSGSGSSMSARQGNMIWREDGHERRLPAVVVFQSVLPQCTVLLCNKLWILETEGVLKVWDVAGADPKSRKSTLITSPGDRSGRGGLLAVINVLDLLPFATGVISDFQLGSASQMAVSDNCSVVTISSSRPLAAVDAILTSDTKRDGSADGADEKNMKRLLMVIDLDHYFHLKPAQCDWDTMNFVASVQRTETDVSMSEGWNDQDDPILGGLEQARRHTPHFCDSKTVDLKDSMFAWSSTPISSRNNRTSRLKNDRDVWYALKSLHAWWSEDALCDPLSVRSLLADHRLGITPKAFHWTHRKIDYGGRRYQLVAQRNSHLAFYSTIYSSPQHLVGEEDLIYHTVSGSDGYGGTGHDYVLGALSSSGVRNPFSPSRNIDSLSHSFLPRWSHTSSVVERREPNAALSNRLTRPDSMWVNGFTTSPQRPSITQAPSSESPSSRSAYCVREVDPTDDSAAKDSRGGYFQSRSSVHNSRTHTSLCFALLPIIVECDMIDLTVSAGAIQAVCLNNDGTQCVKTFRRMRNHGDDSRSEQESLVLPILSLEFRPSQTMQLPLGASLLCSPTRFPYFVTRSGLYSFLPCDALNRSHGDMSSIPVRGSTERRSSGSRRRHGRGKHKKKLDKHQRGVDNILRSSSRQKIINNLIVFSGNSFAMQLCNLNGWSSEAKLISITALALSLRHHELRWLSSSLQALHNELRLRGSRMLMHYIRVNWATFQDRNSFNRLLRVAQHFVTKLIDDRTSRIRGHSSKSRAMRRCFVGSVWNRLRLIRSQGLVAEEVIELMVNLKELREIGFYLNRGSSNSKYGSITQVLAECVDENGKLQVAPDVPTKVPLPIVRYNWASTKWDGFVHIRKEWSPHTEDKASIPEQTVLDTSARVGVCRESPMMKNITPNKRTRYLSRSLNKLTDIVRAPWVQPQRPTDDKTAVRHGIGFVLSRVYEQMDDNEIVYHAARTGQISAALSFLAARRMKRLQGHRDFVYAMQLREVAHSDGVDVYLEHVLDGAGLDTVAGAPDLLQRRFTDWIINPDHEVYKIVRGSDTQKQRPLVQVRKPLSRYLNGASFDWLQNEVGCIAYNHLGIEVDDIHLATRMLRFIGINVSAFFKDVAFYTTGRNLRWKLLGQLSHTCGLSPDEQHSVAYLQLIESLYPNSCYTSEFDRVWSDMLEANLPVWRKSASSPASIFHATQLWPPRTIAPVSRNDVARTLGYGSYLNSPSHNSSTSVGSSAVPRFSRYFQSHEDRGRGVGCGYVVEINLDKFINRGETNGPSGGYTTDASESDDDDPLLGDKSAWKSEAESMLETTLRCGDIDDLSSHGTKKQLGPSSSRQSSRSSKARAHNGQNSRTTTLVDETFKRSHTYNAETFYDRSSGKPSMERPEGLQSMNDADLVGNSRITPIISRHRSENSSSFEKRLSGSRAAGFSIYKRWKPRGPAVAWLNTTARNRDDLGSRRTSPASSSTLAASPSSIGINADQMHTSRNRGTEDRWLPWQTNDMPAIERGYLHLALAWVHAWDTETRERILIERAYELEKRCPLATLPYMVAHNDWRGIVRWIDSLRLEKSTVDKYGRLRLHSSARWASYNGRKQRRKERKKARSRRLCMDTSLDNSSSIATSSAARKLPLSVKEFSDLIQKVKDVMRFSSKFVRELITNELAKRGVFLRSDIGVPPSSMETDTAAVHSKEYFSVDSNSAYWTALLRRLSRSNLLFRDSPTSSKRGQSKQRVTFKCRGRLADLSKLLPFGVNSAPFHRFFVKFCIHHNFTHVLRNFLDHYNLGLCPASAKEICANPSKPWATLLLTGRLGYFDRKSLFEAALHNARFCLYDWDTKEIRDDGKGYTVPAVNPSATAAADDEKKLLAAESGSYELASSDSSIIQVMLDRGRVLMALGTLMYAPMFSMDKLWKQRIDGSGQGKFSVTRSSLRDAVSTWPTLRHVLFSDADDIDFQANDESTAKSSQMALSDNREGTATALPALGSSKDTQKTYSATVPPGVTLDQNFTSHMLISPGDIRTWKGDETMFLLLDDCVGFSICKVFGPLQYRDEIIYEKIKANAISSEPPLTTLTRKYGISSSTSSIDKPISKAFNAPDFPSSQLYFSSKKLQDQAFVESRGAAYYLSKGWPLQAFHRALAEIITIRKRLQGTRVEISRAEYSGGELFHDDICTIPVSILEGMFVVTESGDGSPSEELILKISPAEAAVLQRTARRVALQNLLKSSVLAACTCFLDLCGLDTVRETLRVDAEAAMRIFQWKCESAGVVKLKEDNLFKSEGSAHRSGAEKKKRETHTNNNRGNCTYDHTHDNSHDEHGIDNDDDHAGHSSVEIGGSNYVFSKQQIRDDILNEVASLFIAFPDSPEPEHVAVNAALASLGETTRAMVGDVTNKDSGSVLAWKLVSVFCRVHGLKTSIALLQELARRNDCITFLHEAQREKFEPRQVVDIVRTNFDDQALRDHIYVVAQNMAQPPSVQDMTLRQVDDTLLEGDVRREDVFNIIFASQSTVDQSGREGADIDVDSRDSREEKNSAPSGAEDQKKSDEDLSHKKEVSGAQLFETMAASSVSSMSPSSSPGRKMLTHSLLSRRPILAIVASCFADAAVLDCWVVWLSVQDDITAKKDASVTAVGGPGNDLIVNNGPGRGSSGGNSGNVRSLSWAPSVSAAASMSQLRPVLISLCKRHEFGQLLQSFSIFAPSSILMQYFLFYKAFVSSRYDVAAKYMHAFVFGTKQKTEHEHASSPDATASVPGYAGATAFPSGYAQVAIPTEWVNHLALELTNYLLTETVTDSYGCEQLLSILAVARFSPEYEQLDRTYSLLQRMRVFDDDETRNTFQSSSEPSLLLAAVIRKRRVEKSENLSAHQEGQSGAWSLSSSHEAPSLVRMSSADLFTPPPKVLTMLIERGLFRDAREYATTAGITDEMIHDVTFAEVRAMLQAFQRNFLWDIRVERTKFWVRCYDVFERYHFPRARAAEFFGDITIKFRDSLSAIEHVDLLVMARTFYLDERQMHSANMTKQLGPNRGASFLRDLDLQILMIRTGNQCNAGRGFTLLPSVFDYGYKMSDLIKGEDKARQKSSARSRTGVAAPTVSDAISKKKMLLHDDKDSGEASEYLRRVVASLVNTENIEDAVKLCEHYKFRSLDVEIVRVCLSVSTVASRIFFVRGIRHIRHEGANFEVEIAPNIMELIRTRTGVDKSLVYKNPRSFLVAVFGLAELSQPYCEKILVVWDIMELLSENGFNSATGRTAVQRESNENIVEILEKKQFSKRDHPVEIELFDQIRSMEPTALLSKMLVSIRKHALPGVVSDFRTCHRYIRNFNVSQEQIAAALSRLFIQAATNAPEQGATSAKDEDGTASTSRVGVTHWQMSDLEAYVSLASIEGKAQVGVIIMNYIRAASTASSIAPPKYVAIDHHPQSPRYRPKLHLVQEVELLIIAHFCFIEGCDLNGIEIVLDAALHRVRACVRANEFLQLARLYQALQEYEELEYILDIFMAQGKFDLILKLGNAGIGGNIGVGTDPIGLSVAIDKYLRAHQSHNMERLIRAYMHFDMNREIAETLRNRAMKRVAVLTGSVSRKTSEPSLQSGTQQRYPMNISSLSSSRSSIASSTTTGSLFSNLAGSTVSQPKTTNDALARELLIILQMLIESSRYFSKDDCFQHAARCMALSDFFTVVLGRVNDHSSVSQESSDNDLDPSEMLMGLYSRAHATGLLDSFTDCADAVAMAQACDLHLSWQTWAGSLYEQVVKKHNLSFLKDLHACDDSLLNPAAFDRLTELFKADPERSRHTEAFKAALEFWLYNVTSSLHEIQAMIKSVSGDQELMAMGIQCVGDDFLSALRSDS